MTLDGYKTIAMSRFLTEDAIEPTKGLKKKKGENKTSDVLPEPVVLPNIPVNVYLYVWTLYDAILIIFVDLQSTKGVAQTYCYFFWEWHYTESGKYSVFCNHICYIISCVVF